MFRLPERVARRLKDRSIKIQNKILIALLITMMPFLIGFAVMHLLSNQRNAMILESRRKQLEETAGAILTLYSHNLSRHIKDYACWNDMVHFVQGRPVTPDWPQNNLILTQSFEAERVCVYGLDKQLIWSDTGSAPNLSVEIPTDVMDSLFLKKTVSFFQMTDAGLLQITGSTIHSSEDFEKRSTPYGYLLVAKLWNASYRKELELVIGGKIRVYRDRPESDASDDTGLSVFLPMPGWKGGAAAYLEIQKFNPFASQFNITTLLTYSLFGLFCVIVLGIIMVSFRRIVSRPMTAIMQSIEKRDVASLQALTRRRDEFGKVSGMLADYFEQEDKLLRAIEARAQIQDALEQRDAELRSILKAAPVGIGMMKERVFQSVNEHLCFMTGYDAAELLGKSARLLYPTQEDFDYVGMLLYSGIWDHGSASVETRWQRKDGSVINVFLSSAAVTPADPKTPVVFTATDITQYKDTVERLEESEKEFRTLYEASKDAVMLLDTDGFFDCNPATLKVFGCTRIDEFVGKHPSQFSPPYQPNGCNSYDMARHYIHKALEEGSASFEWMHSRLDGTVFPAEVLLSSMIIRDQPVLQAVVRDITPRKLAEEALRKSEEKIRRITDNMIDMVSQTDADGIYQYVSPSHKTVLGYAPEDMIGRPMAELIHPEDADRVAEMIRNRIYAGDQVTIEFRFQHAEGYYLWLEAIGNPLRNVQNQVVGAVYGTRDITERKMAETNLRELKEFNESIIKTMADGILIQNAQGTFIFSNPAACMMLGYNEGELVGKHWSVITPTDQIKLVEAADRRRAEGITDLYELEVITKSGNRRTVIVHGKPMYSADNRFSGTLAVITDITERKEIETALKRSEERYRSLVDNLIDGVYRSTPDGRFVEVNPAMVKMFGYSSKEEMLAIDINTEMYIQPSDRPTVYPERGYSIMDTYQLKRKDGSPIWVEESVFYVKDTQGKVIYHEGIIRDVTKRLESEAALKISEKRYRDLVNQSMGYICIHDLNGIILMANPAGAHALGLEPEDMIGHSMSEFLISTYARRFSVYLDQIKKESIFKGLMYVRTRTKQVQIWMYHNVKYEDPGKEPYVLCHGQDITKIEQARKEREKLIQQLQKALAKVKTLSGLLPICAGCKRIRDDGGYWNQIENYISDHSEAEFSHGMCPECQRKYYPELFKDEEN